MWASRFTLQRIQEEASCISKRKDKIFYSVRPSGTSGHILWRHLFCVPMTLGRAPLWPQSPKAQDRTGLPRGQEWGRPDNRRGRQPAQEWAFLFFVLEEA